MSKITAGSFGSLGSAVAGAWSEEFGDDSRSRRKRAKPSSRRWRLRKKRRG